MHQFQMLSYCVSRLTYFTLLLLGCTKRQILRLELAKFQVLILLSIAILTQTFGNTVIGHYIRPL